MQYLLDLLGILCYILLYCIITLFIELVVLLFFKNKRTLFRPLIIANVITNPILNLILPAIYIACYFMSNNVIIYYSFSFGFLILLEFLVVFSEAFIISLFANLKYKTCLKYAVIFNLVSFLVGLIISFISFL